MDVDLAQHGVRHRRGRHPRPVLFGLSFWEAFLAIVLGTALGSGAQGLLSTWGPKHGVPQMVISRSAFGFFGNILPAGLNAVVAGIGWFAVNSISGALALHALFSALPKGFCLVLVVAVELRSRSSGTTWCTRSSGTPSRC